MGIKIVRVTTVPMSLKFLIKGQAAFMRDNGYEVLLVSSEGPEISDVEAYEGCKHYTVPLTRKITPLTDLACVFRLFFFLIREKPDLVHSHTPKAGVVSMIAAYLARIPIRLHTVAGLPLTESAGIKRAILILAEKITYKFASKVYPNSYGLKNIIMDLGLARDDKLCIIGNGSSNGINTSYFDPQLYSKNQKNQIRSEFGIQREEFVFIFIGRLVGDKGINELVSAFNDLCSELSDIKLLLVGPFEDDLDPLNELTKFLIEDNEKIVSVGYQDDVRPFLSIAHILVFPSYREGFPNVVLQAGSMGLPSIVTDINGCNEIIKEEHNGIIIPSKDSKSLKWAMLKLIKDTDLYMTCSGNARKTIVNNYEQGVFWNALLEEYEYLVHTL